GDIYSDLNNHYLAHGYYLEGLDVALKSEKDYVIRDAYARIGLVLFSQKQFRDSREYFVKSLELYKKTANSFGERFKIQELINNVGLTFFEENDYAMALQYFNMGLQEIEKLEKDTSLNFYQTIKFSNDNLRAQMPKTAQGVIYGNIGRIYLNQG